MLIGVSEGLLPLLIGSLLGPGAAYTGALISVITVPVGFIAGGIIGTTAKKEYYIRGDLSKFYDFKKRIKKV